MPNVRRRGSEERDPELEIEEDELDDDVPDAHVTMGIGAAKIKIVQWLQREILSGPGAIENQGAPIIQLLHVGSAVDKPVKRWRFTLSEPDRFAKIVVDRAVEYAEKHYGKVRFDVTCPKLGTHVQVTLERPRSAGVDGMLGENEMGASTHEFASQQMDHNQALMTLLLKKGDNNDNFLRKLLQDAYRRIDELEKTRLQNAKLMEDLISMKWLRDDAIEEKRKSAEWKSQFMKMALPVGLSILTGQKNGLAGMLGQGEGPPGAANGGGTPPQAPNSPVPFSPPAPPPQSSPSLLTIAMHVDILVQSIDNEQLQKFMTSDVFKQEQLIMIVQLKEAVEAWKKENPNAPSAGAYYAAPPERHESPPAGGVYEGIYEPPEKTNGGPPKSEEPWTGGFRL